MNILNNRLIFCDILAVFQANFGVYAQRRVWRRVVDDDDDDGDDDGDGDTDGVDDNGLTMTMIMSMTTMSNAVADD